LAATITVVERTAPMKSPSIMYRLFEARNHRYRQGKLTGPLRASKVTAAAGANRIRAPLPSERPKTIIVFYPIPTHLPVPVLS
jgi:hypothetical protein